MQCNDLLRIVPLLTTLLQMGTHTKTFDVTAREAADRLDVCQETVKRWARTGRVPARKNMSGYWVFSDDDLDALPVRGVVEQVA